MALTNKMKPTRLEIPHEPGAWIECRPLSVKMLADAMATRDAYVLAVAGDIPEEVLQRMESIKSAEDELGIDVDHNPYDKLTILKAVIKRWSYKSKVNAESVEALDPITADWVFLESLRTAGIGW